MSASETSPEQTLENNGSWDTIIYVALSVSIVVGLSILSTVCFGLCKYFKKPKTEQPPPSPMCKRQVSIHAQYPPTPHIARLPKAHGGPSRNSSFKMSFTLAKRFQNRASWKLGSLTAHTRKLRTFSVSRRSSAGSAVNTPSGSVSNISAASVVIPMPNHDLPPVHDNVNREPTTA